MNMQVRKSWLYRCVEWLVIAMIGIVIAIVMLEVFMRGLFGMSLVITEELARYLMIWTALLGAVLIGADDLHLKINLFTDMFGKRGRLVLQVTAEAAVICFLLLMIYATCKQLPRLSQQKTLTLGINIAWIYAAIPVSCALMTISSVLRLVAAARGIATGFSAKAEGDRT